MEDPLGRGRSRPRFRCRVEDEGVAEHIKRLASGCHALACASQRLAAIASDFEHPPALVECIPCVTDIDREWRRPVKPMKKKWKKEPIDILFPADPRRPEKRHLLALQTGEELEQRGWMVGMTTLRHQPRNIVYDRMLTADVTLITSTREAGPLVARESLLCGTPVVSVDVGEVRNYLPEHWVKPATPSTLQTALNMRCNTVGKRRFLPKNGWLSRAPTPSCKRGPNCSPTLWRKEKQRQAKHPPSGVTRQTSHHKGCPKQRQSPLISSR